MSTGEIIREYSLSGGKCIGIKDIERHGSGFKLIASEMSFQGKKFPGDEITKKRHCSL
jgi:hypothetical protein